MELSIVVARIVAVTYLAAGVAAFSGRISYAKIVKEFEASQGLTFLAGFLALLVGMLLVTSHNLWVRDWRVLVTLIGWLSLAKGVLLIAFPEFLATFKTWYKHTRRWGYVLLGIGLVFGYFGFLA